MTAADLSAATRVLREARIAVNYLENYLRETHTTEAELAQVLNDFAEQINSVYSGARSARQGATWAAADQAAAAILRPTITAASIAEARRLSAHVVADAKQAAS